MNNLIAESISPPKSERPRIQRDRYFCVRAPTSARSDRTTDGAGTAARRSLAVIARL